MGATLEPPDRAPLALGAIAVGVCLASIRRRPAALLIALFTFGAGCGMVAVLCRGSSEGRLLASVASKVPHCEARGHVLEEAGGLGTLAKIDELVCNGETFHEPGVAVLETDAPSGSFFEGSGWLIPLGSDRFDVARKRAGAHAELATDDLTTAPPTGALAIAARIRAGLRAATQHISPPEAGLIRGLTIGDTDGISAFTIESFRRSGLSHLLAVSGSNVAIVLGGVAMAASRLSFRARLTAGVLALALFVLVVGPDASVLRAAAMGAVGLLALATGTRAEPLHALGVALIVIVLLRPQIVYAVGLHLSLAATAGIILWASAIERRARPMPRVVALPLAVTVSAQAAVVPLLMAVFGEMSVVAPVANLLAAAAIAPATILGLIGAVVGSVHAGVGGLVLRAAEPFATWILWVGRTTSLPWWASVEVPSWSGLVMAVPVGLVAMWTLRSYGGPISLEP